MLLKLSTIGILKYTILKEHSGSIYSEEGYNARVYDRCVNLTASFLSFFFLVSFNCIASVAALILAVCEQLNLFYARCSPTRSQQLETQIRQLR